MPSDEAAYADTNQVARAATVFYPEDGSKGRYVACCDLCDWYEYGNNYEVLDRLCEQHGSSHPEHVPNL